MTTIERLSAPFTADEVRQFTKEWKGRDGQSHSMTFNYIEDETVMDRLDVVLGVGRWSVTVEPISVADGIVKVRLSGTVDGEPFAFEDFGYQTREGGEGLKEAVSDGIRRCGRFLGVGRYLYRKAAPAKPAPVRPRPVAATPPPAEEEDFDYLYEADRGEFPPIGTAQPGDTCADHGMVWKGNPGDLYHALDGGGYHRHSGNTPKARR